MILLSAALIFLAQGEAPAALSWDKIVASLKPRLQGEDGAARLTAVREAIGTRDARVFDLLFETMDWIERTRNGRKPDADAAKKEISRLRDSYSQTVKARDRLVTKKTLSQQEASQLQALNQTLNDLDRQIREKKREQELTQQTIANLDQMESTIIQGCGRILAECAPPLFDEYRKALAKAMGYPGEIKRAAPYVTILVSSKRKEAGPVCESILKEGKGSEAVLEAAANGLAGLGGPGAIDALIDFLGFPNSSVRKVAHETLKKATGQTLLPAERDAWLKWRAAGSKKSLDTPPFSFFLNSF